MTLNRTQVNSKHKHWHAAWRIFIPARRFKQLEPKITHRQMNRLEVFWQNPEITKNSAYLDSLLNSGWCAYPFTKT